MTTTFLLVRHGQSIANIEKRFAGHWDAPLSQLGQQQAFATAAYLTAQYNIDAVYASDLSRAYETGKAIADKCHLPVIQNAAFREINAGDWEGLRFDDLQIQFPDSYTTWMHNIGEAVCDNGESVAHLQERFATALKKIADENDGATVAVATHATPIRSLQCLCLEQPLSYMKLIPWVPNASVTVVTYTNGTFSLVLAGYADHLGNQISHLPANV